MINYNPVRGIVSDLEHDQNRSDLLWFRVIADYNMVFQVLVDAC